MSYPTFGVAVLLLLTPVPISANPEDSTPPFPGTYELISFVFFGVDGEESREDMTGQIHYDAAGNMAAQLMPRDYADNPESGERRVGYTAYFGTYDYDAGAKSVTHHVSGSNNASWVGRDLVRYYAFTDDGLKLSLKRGDRTIGTLAWRRISENPPQ